MNKGGSKTVETSSDIPERYRQFVDENLAIAQTAANRPYIPFQGQRVAEFSPDQQGAFNFVRGMQGSYQPHLSNAGAAYSAAANAIADPSLMMQKYQDPYTQQVIDSTLADVNEAANAAAEQARLSSPFGGSRLGLREAQIEQDRMRERARIGGQLRSDAFRTAAQLGQQGINQLLSAGDRSMGLGLNSFGLGRQYADLLSGIGQQQQARNQALLDTRYGDFLDELNYPLQALSIRQSAIGQTPMGTVGRQPVVQQGGGFGSMLGGFGGLLSGAARIAPFFG